MYIYIYYVYICIYIYVYITTYTCVCICRSKYWSRASVSPRWRSTRSRWPQVASTCATESEIVSTATALRSGLMCCTVVRINGKIHYKWEYGCVWKCCVSLNPMVLLIIIPFLNGYFIGNIPYFQTNPYVRIFQPAWIKIIFDKVKALWDAGWNTLYLCHLCDSVHLTQRPISQLPFTTLRRCREVWLTKRGREVPGCLADSLLKTSENCKHLNTLLGWRMDHQFSAPLQGFRTRFSKSCWDVLRQTLPPSASPVLCHWTRRDSSQRAWGGPEELKELLITKTHDDPQAVWDCSIL